LYPPHPHRLSNVLDLLLAQVLIPYCQLVLDLVEHLARDTNTARFSQCLYPRGDVDPIAIDLLPIDHHIAEVDADAKFHAAIDREVSVPGFELLLDLDRAAHGVDHTGKLGQDAIARRAHDTTMALMNKGIGDLAVGLQGAQGGFFIRAHETAEALHIGAEDGGELALDARGRRACGVGVVAHQGDYPAIAFGLSNGVEGWLEPSLPLEFTGKSLCPA